MPKARSERRGNAVIFDCPGCECLHSVYVTRPIREDGTPVAEVPVWGWNGSLDRPTFTPSILVNGRAEAPNPAVPRCHSFVTDGRIQFLADCTHQLAGQTVDLPEFDPL